MMDGQPGMSLVGRSICIIRPMTAFVVPREALPALKAAGFQSGIDIQSFNRKHVCVMVEPLDELYEAIEDISVKQFSYCGGI